MPNSYQPVIGLEIHVELKTLSKMFCQCQAEYFGKKSNTNVCPVCLGLPGALPVPNQKAIDWTMLIGLALNCKINNHFKFDRKHYFYPDLPKGYQISQYDEPIASQGFLDINDKRFRIHRVHLEEDTGKLTHENQLTMIDFNRSGVPLVEIVTEPDFTNSTDVKRFLEELQVIIRYLAVSDADMEKGSMRLEPNISLKLTTDKGLPKYKVEVKNINSFRFVKQAIDYELDRQRVILHEGKIPIQETRGFNEKKVATYSQRSKEEAHDYRYFPEPDIPPFDFDNQFIIQIKNTLPELPDAKLQRYIKKYKLKLQDAFTLTRDINLALYFENIIIKTANRNLTPQSIANVIINKKVPITLLPEKFVEKLISLFSPKKTNLNILNTIIDKVLKTNQKVVTDIKSGKTNAIMFLVGQIMRELKGQGDAKIIIDRINQRIKSL